MFSVVYSDELTFNIVLQSGLNDVKIDSEINAVFSFLKTFCSCLICCYKTLLINFVKSVITSVKDLINY